MSEISTKSKFIPYARQCIEEDDINAVAEALRSDFLTTGPKVREFESRFAERIGSQFAVSFSSGTAALHGAMVAAGIGPGDEVVVPALSFLATANAAVFVGAKPIFVDTGEGSLNMDVASLAQFITPQTKAIVPVHFAGEPVDLDVIHEIARRHHLMVVEDAAHALGADYKGKPVGALSDMTVFSFHPVKHITTGEGGMVTTNNPHLYQRLKMFRHHGIDVDATQREKLASWYYDMQFLGYNYRLTDIQSALGLSQLKKLDRFLNRRRQIATLYDQLLASERRIARPKLNFTDKNHAWHLYVIELSHELKPGFRDVLFSRLRSQGIGAQVHYRPIHLHTFYRNGLAQDIHLPRIEGRWDRILSLPIYPLMSDDDVQSVVKALLQNLNDGI